jgi:plasmid stabilization system protein ParE
MTEPDPLPDEVATYVLRIHERAVRDIDACVVRLAELASEEAAVAWRNGFREAISRLATNPRRCPLAPEAFRREVRQLVFGRTGRKITHRILFTISGERPDSADPPSVVILHVRHAAARPITRSEARRIESQG